MTATTTPTALAGAQWISRAVPAAQRIIRATRRDRILWAAPGSTLTQTFHTDGPVRAVNIDLAGPGEGVDPFIADVDFTISLESADGSEVARRHVAGPQLLWDYFGQLLEVSPPAPAGEYTVVLRPKRETIGWYAEDAGAACPDDGVSPLPVDGDIILDGQHQAGILLIAVETDPAPNPQFRGSVHVTGELERATLAFTALGSGILRINGVKVGDAAIEPAVTAYDKTVLYRVHDIAHLLQSGANELLIEAGRERFAARGGDIWGWHLAPWHREPMAIAAIDLLYTDRRSARVVTGDGWDAADGIVRRELLFGGETWVLSADEPDWKPATMVDPPRGELRLAVHSPMRAGAPRPPILSEDLGSGRVVYDFGAVMTGRLRCRVTGRAGAAVVVTSGEQRNAVGEVICDNALAAGNGQEDQLLIQRDIHDHTWEIQFGYRGFRWVQIDTRGDVEVAGVRAVPIYTDLERMGELAAGEPLLEWINTALGRTFRNNLHGIPTDTPIYEKNGWTADAHLATEALLHHFDLRPAFDKWLQDHRDAQADDGAIPQIIPTPGWGRAADPAWSSSAVLIPWYLYCEYGDRDVLERNASMIRRYADHLIDRSGGGIWSHRTWSDWLAPQFTIPPEGMAPTGTAMAVTVLQHTAAVLDELGNQDAHEYRAAAETISAAYHDAYFDAHAGCYGVPGVGYRQTMNLLPLAFDMVPRAAVGTVQDSLIADIEGRSRGHLDCGAIGVRHLLPVLSSAGRDDLALTVLLQRTRPGWGAWFEASENTLLEAWDASARSRNHYFLGSVASWIQQRVGGLRSIAAGWREIEIAPVDDPRIRGARMRHKTPLGEASLCWERGVGGWRLDVVVPSGATAYVRVPGHHHQLASGTHSLVLPSPHAHGTPVLT
ncbi:family 78 glycoside hydrolase catalytic domain [Microbacterium deminutum]|uniref:alpha-L-rhamnosidase n=1 Tax=Microbacterium deminutum TaxID=344164 RepID=A0ABP5BJZ8_9MICO